MPENTTPVTETLQLAWHIIPTKDEYVAGVKNPNAVYFIEETEEIYRGTKPYTGGIVRINADGELPAASMAAQNKLYINAVSGVGRISDGENWFIVINPSAAGTLTRIEWDGSEQILDIYAGDTKQQSIVLDGLGVSLSYDKSTGNLTLLDSKNEVLGTPIKLDLERFVTGGEYDATSKNIILYFDGKTGAESTDKVSIPVGDLVDTYTAGETSSVTMDVTNNKFTAVVRISTADGNELVIKDDGLYVHTSVDVADLEAKIADAVTKADNAKAAADVAKAVSDAAADVALEVRDKNTELEGKVTELETKVTTLQEAIKNLEGPGGSVLIDGVTIVKDPDTGILSVGSINIDQVTDLASKLEKTLTTDNIATTPADDGGSDTKVLSEKAILDMLSWKTGM